MFATVSSLRTSEVPTSVPALLSQSVHSSTLEPERKYCYQDPMVSTDIREDFSILQWNIQGINTKSSILWLEIIKADIKVLMLQEVQTHYKQYYQAPDLMGYHKVSDSRNKTCIYIRDQVQFYKVDLKLHQTGFHHEDILYATAVIIRIKIDNNLRTIGLLNIYRSPSGKADLLQVRDYIQQVKDIAHRKYNLTVESLIIGGDLNASHEAWGAERGSASSKKAGKMWYGLICDLGLTIMNDGSPTRFHMDKETRTIRHSWIDTTVCDGLLVDKYTWRSIQLDKKSDHYQILMTLPGKHEPAIDNPPVPEKKWKFPNEEDPKNLWEQYRGMVANQWNKIQSELLCNQDSISFKDTKEVDDLYGKVNSVLMSGGLK